jgi:triosephosphate isomerase
LTNRTFLLSLYVYKIKISNQCGVKNFLFKFIESRKIMAMNKKFIVECNWKMYKTHNEAIEYIKALKQAEHTLEHTLQDMVELVVCVPFTVLHAVSQEAAGSAMISPGAQNSHWLNSGAYTGEISPPMIADAGGRYCVVGHSERRRDFGEIDEMVNRKARALLKAGIRPIVCIGEKIEERERGLTLNTLERQLVTCFESFSPQEIENTVVLYEPVWAIGTGERATPRQAGEAQHYIRQWLEQRFSKETAMTTRIIYGGSVNTGNVAAMLAISDLDGVGVGSASLDVHTFLNIAEICMRFILQKTIN